jgi:transposase
MAKAYSQDLRERAIVAVGRGASRGAAAAQFSISASSAIKWDQRFRKTGSAQAKSLKGRSRSGEARYPRSGVQAASRQLDIRKDQGCGNRARHSP